MSKRKKRGRVSGRKAGGTFRSGDQATTAGIQGTGADTAGRGDGDIPYADYGPSDIGKFDDRGERGTWPNWPKDGAPMVQGKVQPIDLDPQDLSRPLALAEALRETPTDQRGHANVMERADFFAAGVAVPSVHQIVWRDLRRPKRSASTQVQRLWELGGTARAAIDNALGCMKRATRYVLSDEFVDAAIIDPAARRDNLAHCFASPTPHRDVWIELPKNGLAFLVERVDDPADSDPADFSQRTYSISGYGAGHTRVNQRLAGYFLAFGVLYQIGDFPLSQTLRFGKADLASRHGFMIDNVAALTKEASAVAADILKWNPLTLTPDGFPIAERNTVTTAAGLECDPRDMYCYVSSSPGAYLFNSSTPEHQGEYAAGTMTGLKCALPLVGALNAALEIGRGKEVGAHGGPVVAIDHEEGPHSIIRTLRLSMSPSRYRARLANSASDIRKRAHDVRGHWRHFANGQKTWVKSHRRGDETLGSVAGPRILKP